jgi:hypothetical protein
MLDFRLESAKIKSEGPANGYIDHKILPFALELYTGETELTNRK